MATRKDRGDGEEFWRFSLAFYAHPGVAAALIALQDRDGRDVNVMLYALWLGIARGQVMGAADLAAAEAAAAPVRDAVVGALRGLRRRLRPDPDPDIQDLRRRIQALEIAAERLVQYRLAKRVRPVCGGGGDRLGVAAANLALYLGGAAPDPILQALDRFIRRV